MSSSAGNVTVHTGFWVNWEHGLVRGSTITLDIRDSQVLSSFLSAFLTFVGLQLWKIIAYVVHQSRASTRTVDGLHRQQQLVWKQYGGPASSAWAFMKQSWAWRHHASRTFIRTIPLSVLGILYAGGFALLAIFAASEITKTSGNYRLVQPANCGYYNSTRSAATSQELAAVTVKGARDTKAASTYADACYPSARNLTSATRCDLHRKPFIAYQQKHVDACPFGNNICLTTARPFNLDTGLTDSMSDWGINDRPENRIQFRRSTTCAPLSQKNYTEYRNITQQGHLVLHQYSNYGSTNTFDGVQNYTNDYNTQLGYAAASYQLQSYAWEPGYKGEQFWLPIPALQRKDGNVIIYLIAGNGLVSDTPINDPVFNMTLAIGSLMVAGENVTTYTSTAYTGVMACVDQMQFCNPINNTCTDLMSPSGLPNASAHLGLNLAQQESISRLFWPITEGARFQEPSLSGGAGSLKATESISEGISQTGIPDNQWELEVEGWFETTLARMQQGILEFATGPANTDPTSNVTLFKRAAAAEQCKSQMISLVQGTVSYSVVGLALAAGLGCLIILVSFTLELIVSAIQQAFRIGEHRRLAWILDSGFQLHRQVCEAQGYGGTWYNLDGEVPVCDRNAKFGSDGQTALADLKTPVSAHEHSPFIPSGAPTTEYNPAMYAGQQGEEAHKNAHYSVSSRHS